MTDTLRPSHRGEFFGQRRLMARLEHLVHAALLAEPQGALPHLLLTGPAGTGKTALVDLISQWLGGEAVHSLTMPVDAKHLERLVREETGIFFFDQMQETPKLIQARLMSLLEHGYLPGADGRRITNPWFTVIGATTEPQRIAAPLYRHFIVPAWEPYTSDDMTLIVKSMATKAGLALSPATLDGITHAAAGTPAYARQLVEAALVLVTADDGVEPALADVLTQAGFSTDGLTDLHLQYLEVLDLLGGGASPGLLAKALRLHPSVMMDLEHLLGRRGFIDFAGGRKLTPTGFHRLRDHRQAAAA